MFVLGKELNSDLMFVVKKHLDGNVKAQKVAADNIANVNTPGFKASEVHFKDALKNVINQDRLSLAKTHSGHIPAINSSRNSFQPIVIQKNEQSFRIDGNNVDMDKEMEKMAESSVEFEAMTEVIRDMHKKLSSVIMGR